MFADRPSEETDTWVGTVTCVDQTHKSISYVQREWTDEQVVTGSDKCFKTPTGLQSKKICMIMHAYLT